MLGGSLFPGFGIDQSAHWGDLLLHFQQHRQADPALSFTDFLKMHYGADSEHQKHPNHSHQNLPSSSHSVPAYTPNAIRLMTVDQSPFLLLTRAGYFRKADLYAFLTVFALINPPRTY
ncbi:hypothetical protein GCM10028825_52950 [Spirosoma agri]